MMIDSDDVLSFWLGSLDESGLATHEAAARWWKKEEAFDEEIRQRFLGTYETIVAGGNRDWLNSARGRVAYVIVLDQFSRNMFRDTARMFEADPQALTTACEGIDAGVDGQLAPAEWTFLYMPLMHSEELAMQVRCVELFTEQRDRNQGAVAAQASENLKFAIAHRDIINEWGRFPHRNKILNRMSTPAELEFLKRPGSAF